MGKRLDILIFFATFIFCTKLCFAKDCFELQYEWKKIDFKFRNPQERQEAINNGTFAEGKVQPIDVQVYNKGCKQIIFITTPRINNKGVPATLGILSEANIDDHLTIEDTSPIVDPYPSWEWHTEPEMCKKRRIVSVYRVFIDNCHRLWVLDNGIVGVDQVCPPQILAFDLRYNTLVCQYEIPFDQHKNTSLYITPVVDTDRLNCKRAFVYNADVTGYSLLVFDYANLKSWRIFDKSFLPDPAFENYTINGTSFQVADGIFGLSLSPNKEKLYYNAMSAGTLNKAYTKYLKKQSLFNSTNRTRIFYTFPYNKKTQTSATAMDKSGNLYFPLIGFVQMAAWNIRTPFDEKHISIISKNPEIEFPSGVKITRNLHGEEFLWAFATSFQRSATNTLFPNQTNFRMFSAEVKCLRKYIN